MNWDERHGLSIALRRGRDAGAAVAAAGGAVAGSRRSGAGCSGDAVEVRASALSELLRQSW